MITVPFGNRGCDQIVVDVRGVPQMVPVDLVDHLPAAVGIDRLHHLIPTSKVHMAAYAMNPRVPLEHKVATQHLVSMGRNEQIGVSRQAQITTLTRIV